MHSQNSIVAFNLVCMLLWHILLQKNWSMLKIFVFHACTKFKQNVQPSLWAPVTHCLSKQLGVLDCPQNLCFSFLHKIQSWYSTKLVSSCNPLSLWNVGSIGLSAKSSFSFIDVCTILSHDNNPTIAKNKCNYVHRYIHT